MLAIKALRSQMDVKLYVETDDDLRLIRRLKRDINERGRTVESVIEQYERLCADASGVCGDEQALCRRYHSMG